MGLNAVDGEGRSVNLSALDPRPKAKRESATPPDKPLDGATTKTEVERALTVCYNLVHKILHDDVRYTTSDFSEEADGILSLLQQHSQLRVVMRVVMPLAMIGSIYTKIEETVVRFRARQAFARQAKAQRAEAAAQANQMADGVTLDVMSNGLTTDEIRARGASFR